MLHHVAALIGLCDDPIGIVPIVCLECLTGPFLRRIVSRQILNHICPIVELAADDNARLVGILARGHGRVNSDDDPLALRRRSAAGVVDMRPLPKRTRHIVEDLGV